MNAPVLLGNGVLVTRLGALGGEEPHVEQAGAVVWRGERVVAVGAETDLRSKYSEARFLDARGGLIVPGFINLHHHFYSALARGLDPGAPMHTFAEVLDRLWWRLDRALDAETVGISAALSAADCIRWGCTTVFDHHASPTALTGSLARVADEIVEAGLSAVLCYEVTDRNGHRQAIAGLDENLEFLEAHAGHPRVRGIVGMHASFTLTDETLAEVAARRPKDAGCHVHLAEDPIDVEASRVTFGAGPLERFRRVELLDERCLLAHCIHLTDDDYETIARHRAVVIHNPESNANNGVGRLDVVNAAERGCTVGLGTDGMASAMLRALRAAFLTLRAARRDPAAGFSVIPNLLAHNAHVARRFFAEPLLGELAPGAPADIAVIDASPPTPLDASNVFGHLVYGAAEAPVRHTVARGRVLLEDGRHTTVDLAELTARARAAAPALWQRFAALPGGTSFLG